MPPSALAKPALSLLVDQANPDLSVIRALFRRVILTVPGVPSVPVLTLALDSASRTLSVAFQAVCRSGTVKVAAGDPAFALAVAAYEICSRAPVSWFLMKTPRRVRACCRAASVAVASFAPRRTVIVPPPDLMITSNMRSAWQNLRVAVT
jgi:hypothetical protein